jgi:hypothetical protein
MQPSARPNPSHSTAQPFASHSLPACPAHDTPEAPQKPTDSLFPLPAPETAPPHQGRIRRVAASRIAWALTANEWPKGAVRARNGVGDDLRESNLILTKRGPRPFDWGKGGEASSLERRAKTTTRVINALAANPGSTVPVLSKLIGSSISCCCARLGKLADAGLTCGPKCDARARWDLTPTGRAAARASANPVVLDDLDKRVLRTLALAPKRQLQLVREVEVCSLTIKRRARLLIGLGLMKQDAARQPFSITDAGLAALGPDAPNRPQPWIAWNGQRRQRPRRAQAVAALQRRPERRRALKARQWRRRRLRRRCVSASSSRSTRFPADTLAPSVGPPTLR